MIIFSNCGMYQVIMFYKRFMGKINEINLGLGLN